MINSIDKQKNIVIKVENVHKSFQIFHEKVDNLKSFFTNPFKYFQKKTESFVALENINLTIQEGEFIGIIGRNGSGKSTLLKLLAGIYKPNKGKIIIRGRLVPFLELGVGFNPELSARDNIFLNGTILGMSRNFLKDIFDEIVDFAEIREFIDTPIKNFSSGMMVRLAFSIAIRSDGDIFLLDEILSVGDAVFQQKSLNVIRDLIQQGKTIVLVSHSLENIRKYCKKVLWLDHGLVKFFGDTELGLKLYENQLLSDEKTNIKKNLELKKIGTFEVVMKKINIHVKNHNIIIDIHLTHNKKVNILNVVVGLYKDTGEYIIAVGTDMDNFTLPPTTKEVNLEFRNVNLFSGKYYINIAIFGKKENNPYYWQGKVAVFELDRIGNVNKYRGLIYLNHKWSYKVP